MEHKLSNLTHFKQVTLTDEERAFLRGRMAQLVTAPAPQQQPLFMRSVQHGLSIALSSFLFVIFVGGSMSAVASNALPGDPLYSFKVNVNEEIKAAFLHTPQEKVAFAQTRVAARVNEIKTLAQSKTLTQAKQETAQKALDKNIQDLSTQLSTLSDQSPSAALSVTADLQQNLTDEKAAIQNSIGTDTTADPTTTATIQTIDGTIQKVSQQEVKILSKEIDNISTEVDATATDASSVDTTTDATSTPAVTPDTATDPAAATVTDTSSTTPVSP